MSENTNECVIEWIPGRDYVGVTAKNGSSWKNRCEELEKEFPDDVKILARNNDFRDKNGNRRSSLMMDAFDSSIISWQVWETIRKLTCVICGKQYVRQLANVENADEIAEKLCQFVYDLKMDFKKQEDTKC